MNILLKFHKILIKYIAAIKIFYYYYFYYYYYHYYHYYRRIEDLSLPCFIKRCRDFNKNKIRGFDPDHKILLSQ